MITIDENDLLVRTLPTPNPFALKFVVNVPLKDEGKATFHSPSECRDLPLVRDMFTIPGVKQVYLYQNTVTVTHSGELGNEDIGQAVESVLKSRVSIHDPKFKSETTAAPKTRPNYEDPQLKVIDEILDRTIRPGLQADGGDIELQSLENNELKIVYQGACGGCPSAMMGTLDAIQGILRNELQNPELVVTPVGQLV